MPFIAPDRITVRRSDRQRGRTGLPDKAIDTSDLESSIAALGQIQPIVVREEAGELILVAGERRLLTCAKLGLEVEYKLWQDLDPIEAKIIEHEENAKRRDLHWRDSVSAIGELHDIYYGRDPAWTVEQTASKVNLTARHTYDIIYVYRQLRSAALEQATGLENAISILQRIADRKAASIVEELIQAGRQTFTPMAPSALSSSTNTIANGPAPMAGETPSHIAVPAAVTSGSPPPISAVEPAPSPPDPILCTDFLTWLPTYSGPKFNLLHIDFPYGIDYTAFAHSVNQRGDDLYSTDEADYWTLVEALCSNIDRVASYSAHVVFWFSMTFYERTRRELTAAGLWVHEHPLIWMKSDNSGIVPGAAGQYPRRIYETAFLCSRGQRALVKAMANAYACPTAANAIHPSVKPEPMLRHFFSGLVDETTDLFDPTAGSGAALRAAEAVGARSTFGLEVNSEFAKAANAMTLRARLMRQASRSTGT